MPFLFYSYLTATILTTSLSFFLGFFVYLRKRNSLGKAFLYLSLSVSFWSYGLLMHALTHDYAQPALFWSRFAHIGAILIPVLYLQFVIIFVDAKKWLPILKFVWALSFIFLVLNFTKLYIKTVNPILIFDYYPRVEIAYSLYILMFMGCVFCALYLLFGALKGTIGVRRNQIKYFIAGSIIGFGGGPFNFIPMFGVQFFPYGYYFVWIYVAVLSYAIIKHRLMDISLIYRGGLVFASYLVGVLLIFIPIALVFCNSPIGMVTTIIFLTVISPFAYRFLTRISRQAVDKTIFKGRFDYLDKLRQEAESSQPLHTSSEVAERMVEGISSAMNVENCSFMMYNSWRNQFRPKAHKGLKGVLGDYQIMPGITWEVTEPIVRFMVNKKRVLVKEEITTSPSKENVPIIDAMAKIHAAVAVPIFIEYKLIGILGIGRKNTGDMFDTTDLRLLSQLARTLERDLSHTYFMEERTVFSSKVAHDLRSPFNWIMNNLSNMNVGVYGKISEEQRKELSKVFEGMRLLERNIREFFNLNVLLQQVTHGEYRVAKGDIGMLIKNVGDRFKPVVVEKQGIELKVELPSNIPKVIMNAEDIEQHVLGNLITNALKYTEKGKITLGVEVVVGGVICKVQDTGIGIPKHALPHVLKPFFHLHTAGEDKQTGVGLGLVIVKEVVEANGGRVWVESVEGKGATFYFTLPIA